MTEIACCSICNDPRAFWIEVQSFAVMLCKPCLNGVKPVAVVIYDNKVPIKMALDLDSDFAQWRVRLCEMRDYHAAMEAMYEAIEQLISVKMSMI